MKVEVLITRDNVIEVLDCALCGKPHQRPYGVGAGLWAVDPGDDDPGGAAICEGCFLGGAATVAKLAATAKERRKIAEGLLKDADALDYVIKCLPPVSEWPTAANLEIAKKAAAELDKRQGE